MEPGLRLGIPGYRNYVNATTNKEQLNRQTQGKLGFLEARRLTDEEGKLNGSLSLSKPMCPP